MKKLALSLAFIIGFATNGFAQTLNLTPVQPKTEPTVAETMIKDFPAGCVSPADGAEYLRKYAFALLTFGFDQKGDRTDIWVSRYGGFAIIKVVGPHPTDKQLAVTNVCFERVIPQATMNGELISAIASDFAKSTTGN